jgi:hypothetical protein
LYTLIVIRCVTIAVPWLLDEIRGCAGVILLPICPLCGYCFLQVFVWIERLVLNLDVRSHDMMYLPSSPDLPLESVIIPNLPQIP